MEQGFIDVLLTIIKEQGKAAILDASKCKAILKDYAKGEYKKESRFLIQALDADVQNAIYKAADINVCMQQQINKLYEDSGIREDLAEDIVNILAFILRGVPFSKKTVVVYLIIDTSGSMDGDKINKINSGFRDLVYNIKNFENNSDFQIKISVLTFSSGAQWITEYSPIPSGDFSWVNLVPAGVTDFGAAFRALNEKLSVTVEGISVYSRCFFIFSDGSPTDDWKNAFNILNQNKFFNKAKIKAGFAVVEDEYDWDDLSEPDDECLEVLEAFTGSKQNVYKCAKSDKMILQVCFPLIQAACPDSGINADELFNRFAAQNKTEWEEQQNKVKIKKPSAPVRYNYGITPADDSDSEW